jgi:sugar phosphate isomerase/epimerase
MHTLRRELAAAKTPGEIYRNVKAAGYDAVQVKLTHNLKPGDLKKVLDDTGLAPLSLSAVHFGHLLGILKNPKAAVEGAHALGVSVLDISTVFIENRDSLDGYSSYANLINQVGRLLIKEGVKISYHNHSLEFHNFPGGRTGMDILAEETDPAVLNFCLDCHWLQGAGVSAVSWIKKLSGRMTMIHFKDYGIDLGTTVIEVTPRLFKAVGEGNIDWKPITAACKDAGIGIYVVEQDECDHDVYECISSSYSYMRNTLGL